MNVLDASAVLAFLFDEPGADAVAKVIDTAWLSAVKLSEVLTRLARDGLAPIEFAAEIDKTNIQIAPF